MTQISAICVIDKPLLFRSLIIKKLSFKYLFTPLLKRAHAYFENFQPPNEDFITVSYITCKESKYQYF